jgi:hypothetical protein
MDPAEGVTAMRHHTSSYRPSRAGDLIGHTRTGTPIYLAGGGDDTDPGPAPSDAYVFPFAVPADLSTVSDEDLRTVLSSVRDHAAQFTGLPPTQTTADTVRALTACRDLATNVAAVIQARREQAATAASATADLDSAFAVLEEPVVDPAPVATDPTPDPAPDPDPAPAPDPSAVTAARRGTGAAPSVRDVANRAPAAQVPALPDRSSYAVMTAAADVPGFVAGQTLSSFGELARAVQQRLDRYPAQPVARGGTFAANKRPITAYDPDAPARRFAIQNFARHGAVQFRREFPEDLRVRDGGPEGMSVAEFAASQRRLPGGSLVASAQAAVAAGRSLTAAAGWCAPSEVIYDLVELETMDGLLDAPEIQATRGGFQIPTNGGPAFSTIWSGIGSSGDTHLTEAEVIADTNKVCYEIPCPSFEDVRLGVDYVCLTGGLLQRRGYPEVVGRFSRGAMVALAHKINQGVIAQMVTDSGSAVVIPANASGDDAISGLLAAVELAITDIKYRARMGFAATVEIVLPMWVLAQLRASATRRSGVNMVSLADAEILQWFTQRHAVPRFVYDWQDSFSGLSGGPGGSSALTALPETVQFLAYPAGTWVKAVQDVVSLDTIYDSTKLATNEYTAVFAEDGWAMLQMSPITRLYTAILDPSGVVGCCPADVS